jgi:NAD(P)-dependent dehydrogenase (short-subunit alcohol dehydrogenase family)
MHRSFTRELREKTEISVTSVNSCSKPVFPLRLCVKFSAFATASRIWCKTLTGKMVTAHFVLPGMRNQRRGTIGNLGSVAGLLTPPRGSAYSNDQVRLGSVIGCNAFRS